MDKKEQKGASPEEKNSKAVLTKRLPDKMSKAVLTKRLPDKTSIQTKRLLTFVWRWLNTVRVYVVSTRVLIIFWQLSDTCINWRLALCRHQGKKLKEHRPSWLHIIQGPPSEALIKKMIKISLSHWFGIRGQSGKWLKSFSGSSQKVQLIGNHKFEQFRYLPWAPFVQCKR